MPKKTRGEEVRLDLGLDIGSTESLTNRDDDLLGSMLMRGTKTLTREQIDERMTTLKASIEISGYKSGANVSAKTTKENLPGTLQLIADMLKNPSLPASEYEQLRNQMLISSESSKSEPSSLANEALSKHFDHWPVGHPNKSYTIEERIAVIKQNKLENAVAFHRDFYGANNAQIALVGDFDPEIVKAELEKLFGNWNSVKSYTRIAEPHFQPSALDLEIKTPDKANAFLFMQTNHAIGWEHPDYPSFVVGMRILGGGQLKSRLADRIRHKDGLSYGVGTNFSSSAYENSGLIGGYAIAAPENAGKVKLAFREEIALLLKDSISPEELKDAIDGILKERNVSRSDDSWPANRLQFNLDINYKMDQMQKYENLLRALKVEDVNSALRKHIKPEQLSFVIAGDFDAAAKKTVEKK